MTTMLALRFADLYREVSNFLGLGLSPAGENLDLARKYANDGYRIFLMGLDPRTGRAHRWNFLSPQASLAVAASGDGRCDLPQDFGSLLDDFTCQGLRLVPRDAMTLRQLLEASTAAGIPRLYAVAAKEFSPATGQRYEVLLYPPPASPCELEYRYSRQAAGLSGDADLPLGGPQHAGTILEAALMTAEQRHNDAAGVHTAAFKELMAASIDLDAAGAAGNLGPCRDDSDAAFDA